MLIKKKGDDLKGHPLIVCSCLLRLCKITQPVPLLQEQPQQPSLSYDE